MPATSPPARKKQPTRAEYPRVEVSARRAWRAWLAANHATSRGVWAVTWKKATPAKHVSARELNEECLCFGWIDSLPRRLDDARTMLLCTPRKPRSQWSQVNKERVALLDAQGLLAPAGRAAIALAKHTGTWDALNDVDATLVPADLAAALGALANARGHFDAFPRSARRGILEWIANAKTPATRAARVRQTATLAARNERANQWPRRPKP